MSRIRKNEFLLLCYVPNVAKDESVNIAIVVLVEGSPYVRFIKNWEPVLKADPDADIEVLDGLRAEIEVKLQSRHWREALREIETSFSNAIRCTERMHSQLGGALNAETLASVHLSEDATILIQHCKLKASSGRDYEKTFSMT